MTIGAVPGKWIVGEGVETEQQAELLAGFGADQAQGYHFSRPLPADVLAEHLRDRVLGDLPVPPRPEVPAAG